MYEPLPEPKDLLNYEGKYKGFCIGVLTSGGDSQGMNAAVRAVVRMSLFCGCRIFLIKEGYKGLINDDIEEAPTNFGAMWIIHKGGTEIGTARSNEFRTKPGRLKAAKNLIKRRISHLIIIGGDGSLTGANILQNEWSNFIRELLNRGEITQEQATCSPHLKVVGLVATIDNDFPATDMTLGADSALHRITEAVDAIAATASAHRRTFILEVMGRNCGYLALKAALLSEADYLFIPEMPPPENWGQDLSDRMESSIRSKKRLHTIVLSEGAIDRNGIGITAKIVREELQNRKGIDCRTTVLGHVQRGGSPSAFDRFLGTVLGVHAVAVILNLTTEDDSVVLVLHKDSIRKINLNFLIKKLNDVKEATDKKDYQQVISARGQIFKSNYETWIALSEALPRQSSLWDSNKKRDGRRYAVMTIGTAACGTNACIFTLVRICADRGCTVFGIKNGVEGLKNGNIQELKWYDVTGIVKDGGSYLGTGTYISDSAMYLEIANNLKKYGIEALLIIGGFDAFSFANDLRTRREKHSEFCIPIAVIPATINNNVPGTHFSVGVDTALNTIALTCDSLVQSALSANNRIFIAETMGDRCGYLCTFASIASGADVSYIREEKPTIETLKEDLKNMKTMIKNGGMHRGLILRSENTSDNYTTDFITNLYAEDGEGVFTARKNVLGHVQQGYIPSAYDRNFGIKLTLSAISWFDEQFKKCLQSGKVYTQDAESVVVIGALTGQHEHSKSPVESLIEKTDFVNRSSVDLWWMKYRPIIQLMAYSSSVYEKKEEDQTQN